jgi:hypothetical protein
MPRLVSRSVTTANNSAVSGLTETTLPAAQGVAAKGQQSISTDMLQLQVGGPRVAHGFPSTMYLRLHKESIQASSRCHTKS